MEQQAAQVQDVKLSLSEVAPISRLLFSVTKQMRRQYDEQARGLDMTLPQLRVLGQLSHVGNMTQAALAMLIEADQMTTSKILRLLEARGLIERLPDPADSRAKIVRATPQVNDIVATMKTISSDLHDAMLVGISEADKESLVRILNTISDNLAGLGDRPKDIEK